MRLVLGLLFTLSFSCLKGSFVLKFAAGLGAGSQARLRAAITLVSCCQFHLLFYSSRPLANTFATLCVNVALAYWVRSSITVGSDSPANACVRNGGRCVAWLAVACIVFRCDMVLLSVCVIGGQCRGAPLCCVDVRGVQHSAGAAASERFTGRCFLRSWIVLLGSQHRYCTAGSACAPCSSTALRPVLQPSVSETTLGTQRK